MKFEERYIYNKDTDLLGTGGFARVYKAKDILLDRDVAIKIFPKSTLQKYDVVEEIKKVIGFSHPNLLSYYDVALLENTNVFQEKEVWQIGIMEYANYGDLKSFAATNPDSALLINLLKQVLEGLTFLHKKGIIHRDLKPQNILLKKENNEIIAKISDFGISKNSDFATETLSMPIGTIEYMAPEQFSPKKFGINGKISTNLDLWSFGVMVFELLSDNTPFGKRSAEITSEQIMSSILSNELPSEINSLEQPFRTIIQKCLVHDANFRIKTANELLPVFDHQSFCNQENTIEKNSEILVTEALPNPTPPSALETALISKPEINVVKNPSNKNKVKITLSIAVISFLLLFVWYKSSKPDHKKSDTTIAKTANTETTFKDSTKTKTNLPQEKILPEITLVQQSKKQDSVQKITNQPNEKKETNKYDLLIGSWELISQYQENSLDDDKPKYLKFGKNSLKIECIDYPDITAASWKINGNILNLSYEAERIFPHYRKYKILHIDQTKLILSNINFGAGSPTTFKRID